MEVSLCNFLGDGSGGCISLWRYRRGKEKSRQVGGYVKYIRREEVISDEKVCNGYKSNVITYLSLIHI